MSRDLVEIREKDNENLLKDLEDLQKQLFFLRYKAVTDHIENNSDYRNLRVHIARIKTVLRERELKIRGE